MFLVLGPVRALTVLGTIPPDAATLTAAAANHKSRRDDGEHSIPAVGTEAPAEAWPIFSHAGPILNSFHELYWTVRPCKRSVPVLK